MYETFYGLREKPFALVPDPDFLFLGRLHGAALNMLEYALRGQASFTLISGEVGCGKTILVHRFLRMIDDASTTVGMVTNTPRSGGHVLERILLAFNLDYRGKSEVEQYETLMNFVDEQRTRGRRTVLIIDEAHNLDEDSLEELRMLSNINVDKALALQVILVGQPEILDRLNTRSLRQLVQRISVNFRLLPLTFIETRRYIRHRLRVAGGTPDIFEPRAIALVHLLSGGIPRLINVICDAALVYGFGDGRSTINIGIIEAVAADIARGGLETLPGIDDDPVSKSLLDVADELVDSLDDDEASDEYVELPPLPSNRGNEAPAPNDLQHEPEAPTLAGYRPSESTVAGITTTSRAQGPADEPPPLRTVIPIVDTTPTEISSTGRSRLRIVITMLAFVVVVGGSLLWFFWPTIEQMRVSAESSIAPTPPVSETAAGTRDEPPPPLPRPVEVQPLEEVVTPKGNAVISQPSAETDAAATAARGVVETPTPPESPPTVSEIPPVPPAPPVVAPVDGPTPTSSAPATPDSGAGRLGPITLNDALASSDIQAGDFGVALTGLFGLWKLDFRTLAGASPCNKARNAELDCYERDGNVNRLVRLDRPAIIGLKRADQGTAYALLTGRDGDKLRLQIDDNEIVASPVEVDSLMSGSFLMLWKPPPGFDGLLVQGRRSEAVSWVRSRLKALLGDRYDVGAGNLYNAVLANAVREFQTRRGLQVDGIVGIETLIEINSATRGLEVPRLR